MRYRMIGIDLDGTLLDRRGRVSQPNRDAIAAARARGVLVVPCTGRGWRESRMVLDGFDPQAPGVFVGGSAVNRVTDGHCLNLAVIGPDLALRLVEHLFDAPEAVLVYREASRVGHDYLVTGRGSLTANTQWWFEATGATVHFQRSVTESDLADTLRVGIVGTPGRLHEVTAGLRAAFGPRITVQSFEAVQMPDPEQSMHVLETFSGEVDKWRGLAWVAAAQGLRPQQVAVIGDEINDLAMLRSAGCGVAMANAIPAVKELARHVTLDRDEHGVAHAIGKMLAGEW